MESDPNQKKTETEIASENAQPKTEEEIREEEFIKNNPEDTLDLLRS